MNTEKTNSVHLVLGGARSGKSRLAEQMAKDSAKKVVYIATATIYDDEMQQRVERHINDRPAHWLTVEEPLRLAKAITDHSDPDICIVVDCLTLWLTNVLMAETDQENKTDKTDLPVPSLADYKQQLLTALANVIGPVVLVSNEVGQGLSLIHI